MINARHNGFTLLELLIVVTILSVLLSAVIPGFTVFHKEADITAAKSALRALRIKIDEHHALHGAWPKDLDKAWYVGHKYPRNPWLSEKESKYGIAYNQNSVSLSKNLHPIEKTIEGWPYPFWYNSENGELRIRVPKQESGIRSLALYNEVNGTELSDLYQRY